MRDWKIINAGRVREGAGAYNSTDKDGFNGFFCFQINGLPIKVVVSDCMGWEHVSVSIHNSTSTPSWSIMSKVKDIFWDDEVCVVQFHPKKSDYVNFHPGCLHLWRCTTQEFPTPPSIMVGPKL